LVFGKNAYICTENTGETRDKSEGKTGKGSAKALETK